MDRNLRFRRTAFVLSVMIILTVSRVSAAKPLPLSKRISNVSRIVSSLREGFRKNSREMVIGFVSPEDLLTEAEAAVPEWIECAMEETGDPEEGDYIRFRTGGYNYSLEKTREGSLFRYRISVRPVYFTYVSQEQRTSERVRELAAELGLHGPLSDAAKEERERAEMIFRIYRYLCSHVRYDKVHRKNPHSHLKSTAYSALVLGTATCQGFCMALYRLLMEAGIECRIVTGRSGGEELHAWVIARIGERFYLMDPTWDAGEETFTHFLLGQSEAEEYEPGELYRTPEFLARYPLAETAFRFTGSRIQEGGKP